MLYIPNYIISVAYDYINFECNQLWLLCKVIMIAMYITQKMNVILHQYLLSYMYNTDINMLQCLHVALLEPDTLSGMFLKWKCTTDFDAIVQH